MQISCWCHISTFHNHTLTLRYEKMCTSSVRFPLSKNKDRIFLYIPCIYDLFRKKIEVVLKINFVNLKLILTLIVCSKFMGGEHFYVLKSKVLRRMDILRIIVF